MSLDQKNVNGATVIRLEGEFDAAASDSVREEFENLASKPPGPIVLDLSAVSFIDSTGMGLIIYVFKRLQSVGKGFSVCGAHGQPLELFKLLRVDRVIRMFPDVSLATTG